MKPELQIKNDYGIQFIEDLGIPFPYEVGYHVPPLSSKMQCSICDIIKIIVYQSEKKWKIRIVAKPIGFGGHRHDPAHWGDKEDYKLKMVCDKLNELKPIV